MHQARGTRLEGVLVAVTMSLALLGCQAQQPKACEEMPPVSHLTEDSFAITVGDILQERASLVDLAAIPGSAAISNVKIYPGPNFGQVPPLTAESFAQLIDSASPLPADSESIFAWHYAPWCRVTFSSHGEVYALRLFLGGRGFLWLPDGSVGAIQFECPD